MVGASKFLLALLALLLVAAACGDSDLPQASTTITPPETMPASGPATPQPITPAELEENVGRCLDELLPPSPLVGKIVEGCLAQAAQESGRSFQPRALIADNAPEILMIGVRADGDCRSVHEYIAWWTGQHWQHQYLTSLFPTHAHSIIAAFYNALGQASARMAIGPEGARLAIVTTLAYCGSAPYLSLILLGMADDEWSVLWDAEDSVMAKLAHTKVGFLGEGINDLFVEGDSWFYPDERKGIFHESNPGPHRSFRQKWMLQGDRYVLFEHTVQPSAYNALVEFIYHLSIGDDSGATALLADPSLLSKAWALGLAQDPLGKGWLTNLDSQTVCCGPIHIVEGPPQGVAVFFTQYDQGWLISGLEAE